MRLQTLSIVAVLATVTIAGAQPTARAPACDTCVRGNELVEQLSLQPLRSLEGALAELAPGEPLTPDQYARILELRRRMPALVRLGAVDDLDLAAIAAALCETTAGACLAATTRALRCLADRCDVAIQPPSDPERADFLEYPECRHPRSRTARTAPLGLGLEWGSGWHGSRYPADGRAWSLGIEARLRLAYRVSAVARIDRVAGRDEALDLDGNGHDDAWTGSITRIYALAGPSFVLDHGRFEGETRFLSLDLLAGYVSTRSQAAESGFGAGLDLSYQLSAARIGMRFVQGFGDARAATMVLGHLGFTAGGRPSVRSERDDCGNGRGSRTSPSRLALAFDFPLIGYGLSSELGLLASGLGIEVAWNVTRKLDALARADLLIYPGYERDRTLHQAVLAGARLDHGGRRRRSESGYFTTVMGGYSHGAGLTPTTTGSGPIGEVSTGWGIQSGNGAAYLRLHARFGLGPDNVDYRALFLSGGFEMRFDRSRWSR